MSLLSLELSKIIYLFEFSIGLFKIFVFRFLISCTPNLFKLDGNYASDWVINIGALSIMYEPAGADFTQMDALKNTVNKMLELADTGIVITLLSANAQDVFDEQYLAYDPVEVLDWALNEYGQLGGNVRLDHSIADSLFTLTIYK